MNQLNRVTQITPSGTMTNIPFTYSDGNTVHTDTLAVGSDGALYATSTATLFRYDRSSGVLTRSPFPITGSGRGIEPNVMIATADGSLYFDDSGSAMYRQSIPGGAPALIGRGSATPQQGDALSPTSLALARDGTLWFSSSSTSLDGQPIFGHIVGGSVQLLVGQSKVAAQNANFQNGPASSIVLGGDGRIWYSRNDALGSFAP
jgi:sugar lactone lactonase YvrE